MSGQNHSASLLQHSDILHKVHISRLALICAAASYNSPNTDAYFFISLTLVSASDPSAQIQIIQPISADLNAVDTVIRLKLHSEVVLVNQIADYIISAGGKRIRPVLVL